LKVEVHRARDNEEVHADAVDRHDTPKCGLGK
jgi:hypothetical protein